LAPNPASNPVKGFKNPHDCGFRDLNRAPGLGIPGVKMARIPTGNIFLEGFFGLGF
jgi:hypothetical protein